MAVQIRIVPDEVQNIANIQLEVADSYEACKEKIETVRSVISEVWNSVTANQISYHLKSVGNNFHAMADAISHRSMFLVSIANAFAAADADVLGQSDIMSAKFAEYATIPGCPSPYYKEITQTQEI